MTEATERTTQRRKPREAEVSKADQLRQEHFADRAKRQAERDAKANLHVACLDWETAKRHEARKPVFDFEVSADIRTPSKRGLQVKKETLRVQAANETEAWAKFCDSVGAWPSRRGINLQVEKLGEAV